nr:immunoglobulin light chain junction region [Macaca mulatta]MOX17652.1 immunoglobulin light chain junction region [Macaca mulatta]MOX18334.1 immunoglobulin light chain junction region [Macaca mulatta]MOX19133.1 immunoglobulin light chain junction region [Macaca mulatta]MOX19559.1 immunoglobulin light chain junction region [Macaca mulatta]
DYFCGAWDGSLRAHIF